MLRRREDFFAGGFSFFANWQTVRFGLADQFPIFQLVLGEAGEISSPYAQRVSK